MRKNKIIDILFGGMFIVYLFLMIDLLFFRWGMDSRSINLIPFKSILEGAGIHDGIRHISFDVQVWGNVLIFIPAGVYIMVLLRQERVYKAMLGALLLSMATELIQYVFAIGASDIDDIILNCLGGAVGVLAYCLLKKQLKEKDKVRRIISYSSAIIGIPVLIITILLFFANLKSF